MQTFLSKASLWIPESFVQSAWTEHAPFGFWLMDILRPTLLVELGTHYGFSYFVFNQALKQLRAKCRCFAVDTWRGDEHAGYYGDEVFQSVSSYNQAHYGDFSELLRMTFDEAVDRFENASIDLLHIDGRHFYSDVKHDFETWKPKLSARAIVVLHDTNVRTSDFGVYRLWEELQVEYPHFEFFSGHGLGVLGVGDRLPTELVRFFDTSNRPEESCFIRATYGRLSAALIQQCELQNQIAHAAAIKAVPAELEDLKGKHTQLDGMYHQAVAQAAHNKNLYDELTERHQTLETLYQQLASECATWKHSHDTLHSSQQQLEDRLHRLSNEEAETKARHRELQELHKALETTHKRLEAEHNAVCITNADLQSRYNDFYERHCGLKTRYKALEEGNCRLRLANTDLEQSQARLANEHEGLRSSYDYLQARHAEIEKELEKSKSRAAEAFAITAALTEQLSGRAGRNASLQAQLTEMAERRAALEQRTETQERELRGILMSKSWRITAPLRRTSAQFAGGSYRSYRFQIRRVRRRYRDALVVLFDKDFYLAQNPDVAQSSVDPLNHYLSRGAFEGRDPHALFDSDWYIGLHPDVKSTGQNPLLHYLEIGANEGYNPHPLFNSAFYIEQNPVLEGVNPLQHYLTAHGRGVGDPHPLFHTAHYISQRPGLSSETAPLVDYLQSGWKDWCNPNPLFDVRFYLAVSEAIGDAEPLRHYVELGSAQGRDPHALFRSSFYVQQNPSVSDMGWTTLGHYLLTKGRNVGNPHPLFDTVFYLAQVPHLPADVNPLIHYLKYGWREQLSPHRLFDTAFYFATNPDVQGTEPLQHYLQYGTVEGRNPHPLFDTVWYRRQYADVANANVDPLLHYVLTGSRENRDPHTLFNSSFYVTRNPVASETSPTTLEHYLLANGRGVGDPHPLFDTEFYLAQVLHLSVGVNPLIHYMQYGWRDQLNPHPLFDVPFYLEMNPDVTAREPLQHYLQQGTFEGRNPHPLFDSAWYRRQHASAMDSGIDPLVHFICFGHQKMLSPSVFFDSEFYLDKYPDVKDAGLNPLIHYVQHGGKENRQPSPTFDSELYVKIHPEAVGPGSNPLIHYVRLGRFEDTFRKPDHTPAPQKRRVVFISGEPATPGHKYRIANLANALPPAFFDVAVVKSAELSAHMREFVQADVVWIWRAGWSNAISDVITVAKRSGAKLVFDVDDLMFRPELAKIEIIDGIRSQGFSETQIEEFYSKIQAVLGHADYCTAPTSTLARELRTFAKPVGVIPNGFDSEMLRTLRTAALKQSQSDSDGLIRIGYAAGTLTHQRDLAVASHALADVLSECPACRLVLFRGSIRLDEFPELARHAHQIEWRDKVPLDALPDEYARFTINIAPLEVGNRYCEAKSELKYFEAALANVPTIASPTQPFADAIRDEETGFLASNVDQWRHCLLKLVHDPELRASMAAKARLDVTWLYGPERRSLLLSKLINEILSPVNLRSHLFMLETRPENPRDIPVPDVPPYRIVFQSPRRNLSRVSVVIPVFNYAGLLPEALESLRSQTVKNFDVVVVDDCSTDDSLLVAEKWLRRHAHEFDFAALLQNHQNSKLGRSRNAAVSFSDTELFLPLDPDNVLLPDCIESSVEILDQTGAAFAYPTIEVFGDQTGTMGLSDFNPALFRSGNYIDAMAMVRKACWIVAGGYSPLEPVGWEDYDFWCKLTERGLFGVRVPKVVARYRVHGKSMLRTITELPENKPRVIDDLNARHPWLDLRVPVNTGSTRGEERVASDAASGMTIGRLIDILQCPETGEELTCVDGDTIMTKKTGRLWPVVKGRPVFTPDGMSVPVHPNEHTSNPLPDEAVRIIRETAGLVLNLSAGASATRYTNVVELEYSIFKHTDVVGDVHRLPFKGRVFDAVVCLNAFEHYREPDEAMGEIRRILKPGGRLFLHTAFLQPLHEAPHHYYNCTEFGLRQWLRHFEETEIRVSSNFNPVYTLSWLASELELAFKDSVSAEAAEVFRQARLSDVLVFWRDLKSRNCALWDLFYKLPSDTQRRFAAGWEAHARKSHAEQNSLSKAAGTD